MRRRRFLRNLIAFAVIIAGFLILAEVLMYVERDAVGEPKIDTYYEALWYMVVTVSTVGYGDYVPQTFLGKLIGISFVLSSVILAAVGISKLTSYWTNMRENEKLGFNGTKMSGHTVIIGWDHFSRSVAEQLEAVKVKLAIVTDDKDDVDLIYESFKSSKDLFVLYSEYDNYELLKLANPQKARAVFVNAGNDTDKLVHLINLRNQFPEQQYIVALDNTNLKDTFSTAGVRYAVSKLELSSKLLASYIFEPDCAVFGEEILNYAKKDDEYDIKQFYVNAANPFIGKDYLESFIDMKKRFNAVLIGLSRRPDPFSKHELIKNPENETIKKGDYVLILANLICEKKVVAEFGETEGIFES